MSKTDALIKATGVNVTELAGYKAQATELAEFLKHSPCKTPAEEAWFSAQLSNVRALVKVLEDNRKSLTAPLNEAKRGVDALFAPAVKPMQECEAIIRGKLAGAAMGRMEQERAAMRLAEEAARSGDDQGVMAALAEVPAAVETTGSSATFEWVPEVTDFGQLSDSYKVADMAKLAGVGRAAKAAGTEPNVPGVTFRKTVKVRAK